MVADRIDHDDLAGGDVGRDRDNFVFTGGLDRAGRDHFVDVIGARSHAIEAVAAVRTGDGGAFSRIEDAVVIGIDEHGDAGNADFAGIPDAIAVQIVEFGAVQRHRVLEVELFKAAVGDIVGPRRAQLDKQIEIGGGRIGSTEQGDGHEEGIIIGAAAAGPGLAEQDRDIAKGGCIHVIDRSAKRGSVFNRARTVGIEPELVN